MSCARAAHSHDYAQIMRYIVYAHTLWYMAYLHDCAYLAAVYSYNVNLQHTSLCMYMYIAVISIRTVLHVPRGNFINTCTRYRDCFHYIGPEMGLL